MKCTRCAAELDESARFCGVCGTRLASELSGQVAARPPAARDTPGADASIEVEGDPLLGRTLNGRYHVEVKLGEGGFGAVYRGLQLSTNRPVALKVLHPAMARDPKLVARFRREGSVACQLGDPHTVTTYDVDQTPEGTFYMAMELLVGRSLYDTSQEQSPMPWRRVLGILEQLCTSLGEAHGLGIVHRDIKPENIYLEPRAGTPDFVKVLDFGVAKIVNGDAASAQLTALGQTLGTLEYMSPEQLMGKPLDGRSDLYSMGVMAYELLTGQLPFASAKGPTELISAQLKQTPVAPGQVRLDAGIPAEVDRLVLRMIARHREQRFEDAADLRSHVLALLGRSSPRLPAGGGVPRTVTPGPLAAQAGVPHTPADDEAMTTLPVDREAGRDLARGGRAARIAILLAVVAVAAGVAFTLLR